MSKFSFWMVNFAFLAIFLLVLFAIPRGFDFTDEGLYLLLAKPEQENFAGVFNYDLFFKLWYQLFGLELNIIGMRVLRLLSHITGAIFLYRFSINTKLWNGNRFILYLICFIGLSASYAFLPQSFSYNHLTLLAACIWLYAFTKRDLRSLGVFWLGLSLAILFYAKITACFLLSIFTLIRITYLIIRGKTNWKKVLLLVVPFMILELLFFLVLNENGFTRVSELIVARADRPGYLFQNLIKNSLVGAFWLGISGIPFLIMGYFLQSKRIWFPFLIVGVGVLAYSATLTTITAEYSHFAVLILCSLISYHLGKSLRQSMGRYNFFLISVLLLLPFCLYFGSNIYFFRLSIHYIGFWILAYLVLRKKSVSNRVENELTIISLSIPVIVAIGLWIIPSHYPPLYQLNSAWSIDEVDILISVEQKELLENLNTMIGEENESSMVFVFANPGVPFLLGKTMVKTPLLWNDSDLSFCFDPDEIETLVYNGFETVPAPYKDSRIYESVQVGPYNYMIFRR